jgi:hypothetical protein
MALLTRPLHFLPREPECTAPHGAMEADLWGAGGWGGGEREDETLSWGLRLWPLPNFPGKENDSCIRNLGHTP